MTKEIFYTKPFDLNLAKQRHPVTCKHYFDLKIIHISIDFIIVMVNTGHTYKVDFKGFSACMNPSYDLLLAPLGYCENIPVWGGDKLIQNATEHKEEYEFTIGHQSRNKDFTRCHWPKPERVFPKNVMTHIEYMCVLSDPNKTMMECLDEVIKFNILAGVIKESN